MARLCLIAEVSRKNYYRFKKGEIGPREAERRELAEKIEMYQDDWNNILGYRQMTMLINYEEGAKYGRKRVLSVMREIDRQAVVRRKKYSEEVYAKKRDMKKHPIPDLLDRFFFWLAPAERFVSDITCIIGKGDEKAYLASFVDLFNGELPSWSISRHCDTQLCLDVLEGLIEKYGEDKLRGAMAHNDHGTPYVSISYRVRLAEIGMVQSCGSVADCYDNARMESMNGIVKDCLTAKFGKKEVENKRVPLDLLVEELRNYIPRYNNERPKENLGGIPPVAYRERYPGGTWLMELPKTPSLDNSPDEGED